MSANQDPASQHIMYQQQSYGSYQASPNNTIGTWGQPQQNMPYAVAYHNDASYADKAGYGGAYPPLQQYATGTEDQFYRPYTATQYGQTQQAGQWTGQQGNYQQAYNNPQSAAYGSYSTGDRDTSRGATFNPGAPPPNIRQPPPAVKRDNGENTFQASLSMLDNPAQNSAAYTASWVSSTSSIPPEMKDEPEFGNLPRDDLGANVFNSTNFQDQFQNMSMQDNMKNIRAMPDVGHWENNKPSLPSHQWPGLGQPQDDGRNKKGDQNSRSRDAPREVTWDDRLRRARAQADRAEQKSGITVERGPGAPENMRPSMPGRGRGQTRNIQRNGDSRLDSRVVDGNGQNRDWKVADNGERQLNGVDSLGRSSFRGRNGQSMRGGLPQHMGLPPMFPGQPPMMMHPRGGPFMRGAPPPPPHLMNLPQDERFKNTWLDANNAYMQPFPMGFPPVPFGMDSRFARGRGRGVSRGGMNRGGFSGKKDYRRDGDAEQKETDGEASPNHEDNVNESSPVKEHEDVDSVQPTEVTSTD